MVAAQSDALGMLSAHFPALTTCSFDSDSSGPQRGISTTKGRSDMNNADLAEALAETLGTTKADARKAVDAVFAAITDAAAKGEEVSLNGFGKFKVKASPAREGRNPATGATIKIAASNKLTFSPAKAVKDRLNG
ncbi:HU family DNA-binding protein [Sphingosinicella xenopeptidilytica]|uniref:HU family DNA-binding protein n=1 Tax=Sphingosinicella xenopeptidilytica TaxID=364098 RepID=A0ABW3C4M8_SPHXN